MKAFRDDFKVPETDPPRVPSPTPQMFVVYFGRKETDAEEARMRARRCRYESGEVTIDVPKIHPGRPWDWNWRGSFRAAVATEWRWVAGRCERAVCLSMDDDDHGPDDHEQPANPPAGIVGVALRNGRGFTVSGDGRCRCWDAKSGEAIATWPAPSRNEPSSSEPSPSSSEPSPSSSPSSPHHANPATCMAHGDGIAVVGYKFDGLIRGFDVDAADIEPSKVLFTRRAPDRTSVTTVALGGGWIVAGTDGGAVVTMSAADGTDVVRLGSDWGWRSSDWEVGGSIPGGGSIRAGFSRRTFRANASPRFERGVTACAVDPSGRFAAVAAGAEVVTWTVCDETTREDGDESPLLRRRRSFGDGLTRCTGHSETVRCMAFVPRPADGPACGGLVGSGCHGSARSSTPFLVTGGDDATIRIWDPVSGRCLRELEGPPGTAEAEHAGQTPVEWRYSPPPGVTCVDVWAGQIVEGRDDGSVLHWSGAFDGLRFDHEVDGLEDVPNPTNRKTDGIATVRGRRHRPSAYRRWWVHAERVTAVLVRGGRVVSVGDDGECHVMALPEDALRRARATLAAEGRREAEHMRSAGNTWETRDADVAAASEGAESLGSPPPARNQTGIPSSNNSSANNSSNAASGTSPSNWRPGGVNGYHRRLSSEFMNVAARCAHTAWRGGRGAASAVARSTEGLARRTEAAGMRLLESADALSGGAASAAAALANSQAAAASAAARSAAAFAVAAELSHLAIGQLYSGGEFRAIGGVRFREHKRSIGCVAADREMLVTGDEDGNVFVRDFEPAHLGN